MVSLSARTALAWLLPLSAFAQSAPPSLQNLPSNAVHWQSCIAITDSAQRLACFDRWAGSQPTQAATPTIAVTSTTGVTAASTQPLTAETPARVTGPGDPGLQVTTYDCRDPSKSDISRFWELEADTDCGTFRFRGYRPISVSVISGTHINRQPSSPAEGHQALTPVDYRKTEMRIQLSVRTKVASNLLTQGSATLRDSLWVGYTQQSHWQLFSPDISRPFRNTDHEPEVMYVYPTQLKLPFGWQWRYTGLGLVHQSNGQSLPLSRSWNRVYLMTGLELDRRWSVNARIWKRLSESNHNDDNPRISDYIGRGELQVFYTPDQRNTYSMTLRHSLGRDARGSTRLEWQRTLGEGFLGTRSNLRLHAQIFTGYGESLIDYNRRRTVFALGLSLVDF